MENTADKEGQYSYTNGRNDYFGYGRIKSLIALLVLPAEATITEFFPTA